MPARVEAIGNGEEDKRRVLSTDGINLIEDIDDHSKPNHEHQAQLSAGPFQDQEWVSSHALRCCSSAPVRSRTGCRTVVPRPRLLQLGTVSPDPSAPAVSMIIADAMFSVTCSGMIDDHPHIPLTRLHALFIHPLDHERGSRAACQCAPHSTLSIVTWTAS